MLPDALTTGAFALFSGQSVACALRATDARGVVPPKGRGFSHRLTRKATFTCPPASVPRGSIVSNPKHVPAKSQCGRAGGCWLAVARHGQCCFDPDPSIVIPPSFTAPCALAAVPPTTTALPDEKAKVRRPCTAPTENAYMEESSSAVTPAPNKTTASHRRQTAAYRRGRGRCPWRQCGH